MISKLVNKKNRTSFKRLFSYTSGYKSKISFITAVDSINSIVSVGIALLTKQIIDYAINHQLDDVKQYAFLFVFILMFRIVLSKYMGIYKLKIKNNMKNEVQYQLMSSYYRQDWLIINHYRTGDLTTRANSDTTIIVNTLLSTVPSIIALIVQLITAFIVLSSYDQLIALVAFIIGPAMLLISWFIGQKLKALQAKIQIAVSNLRSHMTESLQNIELIKTFNLESDALEDLNEYQIEKRTLLLKKSRFSAIAGGVSDFGFTFGFLFAILLGAYKLYNGDITFGTFTAFSQLVSQIQGPIMGLTMTLPSIITVLSSIERITVFDIKDKKEKIYIKGQELDHIEFDHVGFSYTEDKEIIKDLSFKIKAKDKIGIKGTSGEGKTTIIRLLLTLIEPQSGAINIHYKDHTYNLNSVSNQYFSYVPQSNSLFTGTIRHNLLMAHKTASEDMVVKALKAAEIYDFTLSLSNGLDTHVGERLEGLSEGQAQRYCIARALLHQTPFLIFDEATSALDIDTEMNIVSNIEKMYPNKGLISITHRTPILDICDHVYTLKDFELIKQ